MFFRIKKVKGKEYGYEVENRWIHNGCKQKVKGYLGRVHKFRLMSDISFLQFLKIEDFESYSNSKDTHKMIIDLIDWELFRFDVNKAEFSIDLRNAVVRRGNKNVALAINDGLMCSATLRNLINIKTIGDEQNDGYRLARACVEAGLKVPQEVFVVLFNKIFPTRDVGTNDLEWLK